MRIIIDTNVVISAVFFGGIPRRIIEAVMEGEFRACGTAPIIEEYEEVVSYENHHHAVSLSLRLCDCSPWESKRRTFFSDSPDCLTLCRRG